MTDEGRFQLGGIPPEEIAAAFGALTEDNKVYIAEALAQYVWAAMRSQALADAKAHDNTRYLHNGTEITQDQSGNLIGFPGGKGQFDIVDFLGGTTYIASKSNARQLEVRLGGGGADCMFTHITSVCFATLTGFTEGMTFTSLSGCTFKGYSTVQGAATAISALGANVNPVLYVCAGQYNENVTFTGPGSNTVSIIGAGRDAVNIVGQSAAGTTLTHTTTATTLFRIRDMTITVNASTASIGVSDVGGSSQWFIDNVKFTTSLVNTVCIYTGVAASAWQLNECAFNGAGIGFADNGPDNTGVVWGNVVCVNCDFNTAVAALFANDSNFTAIGCVFRGATGLKNDTGFTSTTIDLIGNIFTGETTAILCSAGGAFNRMGVVNNRFINCTTAIDMGTAANAATTCRIEGNGFYTTTAAFKAIDDTSGQFSRSVIVGNVFRGYTSGNEMIGLDVTDNEIGHNETDSGATLPDTHTLIPGLVTAEHHVISAQVDVTVASTTVPYQVVGPMTSAGTITGVEAKSGENKTNGATSSIFDVHKVLAANADTDGQGTTIFTTQANRPTITNTHMKSSTTAPDVTAFAAGDYFLFYTDQSGTTLTVANIGVRYTIP